MKNALLFVAGLLLCILAAAFLTKKIIRGRNVSLHSRILAAAGLTAVFLLAAGACYFGQYYRADSTAKPYLESRDGVTVSESVNGYLFDGPGEGSALIFYPGAKVEAEAYAPLLFSLAEAGEDVFLVRMPLRFALFGIGEAGKLMSGYDYDTWYLAGHSLGGVAAGSYAADHPDEVSGIVFLASYPVSYPGDGTKVLSVYGSEDGCLDRKAYEESRKYWPDGKEVVIEGGNHAQFGNYGEQQGDGKAEITAGEQQAITVRTIIEQVNE